MPLGPRLVKKVQMQGGKGCAVRDVLGPYVAAPRERANAADGPFSAAYSDVNAPGANAWGDIGRAHTRFAGRVVRGLTDEGA